MREQLERQYVYLYKRTIDNILKPLREKYKLRSYSLAIEKMAQEWLEMKAQLKKNPQLLIGDEIKKLLKEND